MTLFCCNAAAQRRATFELVGRDDCTGDWLHAGVLSEQLMGVFKLQDSLENSKPVLSAKPLGRVLKSV